MASRRSSRLSTTSNSNKDATPAGIGPEGQEAAKPSSKRKVTGQGTTTQLSSDGFAVPSTPKRKKVVKTDQQSTPTAPPSTPTPAAASLMAVPYRAGTAANSRRTNRLADPQLTNAPLLSPEKSRLIANEAVDEESPSKTNPAVTTTSDILEKGIAHLIQIDPKLKAVIEKHHCKVFAPEGLAEVIDPFTALSSGIIGQQVSGAAAKSIKAKFVSLFNSSDPGLFPTPAQVAAKEVPFLRTAGLSERKAEYIKGLAEKFTNGELSTEMLLKADYEEVFEKLIAVRGLGKWSVEMFACFGLKRMDVFSTGDLGVQRGMAAYAGRDVGKLKAKGGGKWKYMSEKDMLEIAEKFTPYRSLFMWYMWRIEEVDTAVLEA